MRERGYDPGYSAGITAASSVIGPILPPSIALVVYGWLANVSIGALFLAGLVPGVLLAPLFMGMTGALAAAKRVATPAPVPSDARAVLSAGKAGWFPLLVAGGSGGGLWG